MKGKTMEEKTMQEHLETAQKYADEVRAITYLPEYGKYPGPVEGRLLLAIESLIAALDQLTDSGE